jgi:hypothetical protein
MLLLFSGLSLQSSRMDDRAERKHAQNGECDQPNFVSGHRSPSQ